MNEVTKKDGVFALPISDGVLSSHFGHAEFFRMFTLKDGSVVKTVDLTPPPHAPGVIPKWLNEQKANVIITGGIGQAAVNFFTGFGIDVLSGAPNLAPEKIIEGYLNNTLHFSGTICDHHH